MGRLFATMVLVLVLCAACGGGDELPQVVSMTSRALDTVDPEVDHDGRFERKVSVVVQRPLCPATAPDPRVSDFRDGFRVDFESSAFCRHKQAGGAVVTIEFDRPLEGLDVLVAWQFDGGSSSVEFPVD